MLDRNHRFSEKGTISLTVLLAVLLAASSCGSSAAPANEDETADSVSVSPTETEPQYVMWQNLPETDLGGYEFHIIESPRAANTGATVLHGDAEALTGEAINDAIYNRNLAVEDRYNCVISTVSDSAAKDKVIRSVKAGDDAYAAVLDNPTYMMQMALENDLLNLYNVKYIDLSNPWYNQNQVSTFTIQDKLYFFMGDFSYSTLMFGACLIYNVELAERLDIPYIYDIVMDGKWTIDKMYEITANVSQDLDGDGKFTEGTDRFAYAIGDFGNLMNFWFSSDSNFIGYDKASGTFVDTFDTDKVQSIVEKMNRVFNEDHRGILAKDHTALFNGCETLMRSAYVGSCINHRDMADTFTPIPYPKFDEGQDGYRSMMTGSALPVGIPTTVADPDSVGLIMEALSESSAGELNDAVYERVLSYQTMRTEDALDSLRVIHKSLIIDFGYLTLSGKGDPMKWVVGNLVKKNSTDVASYYASYIGAVTDFYGDLIEKFSELE